MPDLMNLKILLPFQVHTTREDVSRIVAETREGSVGILPHRLDFVAALTPGILVYETPLEGEVYLAIHEGVMVKAGLEVLVSVRRAMVGTDLSRLHEAVERDYRKMDELETEARTAMAKLETGFLQRFARLHDA